MHCCIFKKLRLNLKSSKENKVVGEEILFQKPRGDAMNAGRNCTHDISHDDQIGDRVLASFSLSFLILFWHMTSGKFSIQKATQSQGSTALRWDAPTPPSRNGSLWTITPRLSNLKLSTDCIPMAALEWTVADEQLAWDTLRTISIPNTASRSPSCVVVSLRLCCTI